MSFQLAIPWRGALQHCPPPLHQPQTNMLFLMPKSGSSTRSNVLPMSPNMCYPCLRAKQIGGVAAPIKKMPRSILTGADGVVDQENQRLIHHPVRGRQRRLRSIFLYAASTPPIQEG